MLRSNNCNINKVKNDIRIKKIKKFSISIQKTLKLSIIELIFQDIHLLCLAKFSLQISSHVNQSIKSAGTYIFNNLRMDHNIISV